MRLNRDSLWEKRKEEYFHNFNTRTHEGVKLVEPKYWEIVGELMRVRNVYYLIDDYLWVNLCKKTGGISVGERVSFSYIDKFNELQEFGVHGHTKYSESGGDFESNGKGVYIRDNPDSELARSLEQTAMKVYQWSKEIYDSQGDVPKKVEVPKSKLGILRYQTNSEESKEKTELGVINGTEYIKTKYNLDVGVLDNKLGTKMSETVNKVVNPELKGIKRDEKDKGIVKNETHYKQGEEIGYFDGDQLNMISHTDKNLTFKDNELMKSGNPDDLVTKLMMVGGSVSIIVMNIISAIMITVDPLLGGGMLLYTLLLAILYRVVFRLPVPMEKVDRVLDEDLKYLNSVHILEDKTPVRLYEVLYAEDNKVKVSTDIQPISAEEDYKKLVVHEIDKSGVIELYDTLYKENKQNIKAIEYEQEKRKLEEDKERTQKAVGYIDFYKKSRESNKDKLGVYHRISHYKEKEKEIEDDMDKLIKENKRLKDSLKESIHRG